MRSIAHFFNFLVLLIAILLFFEEWSYIDAIEFLLISIVLVSPILNTIVILKFSRQKAERRE